MSLFIPVAGWLAALAFAAALFTTKWPLPKALTQRPRQLPEAAREAGHARESESKAINPLAFSTDLAVWTFVVFVLLFGFLSYFAWPQIAAALDERERKITDNVAAAMAGWKMPNESLPSTKPSWRPRRAKCVRCWKRPGAMPITQARHTKAKATKPPKTSWTAPCARSAGPAMLPCKIWRSPAPTSRSIWPAT